ncbi:CHAT domain-containing protein [Actinosynnema sp. NPDC023794]
MDTEQLIASLLDRVDAFFEQRDPDVVMAPEAVAEADALAAATDPDSVAAVAWWYWCRYFAGDPDIDTVSAFVDRFLALRPEHPEALPEPLSAALDLLDGHSGEGNEFDAFFLYSLGGAFHVRFSATGDRLDLDREVAALTECAARLPAGEEFHGAVLCALGAALTNRLRQDGPASPDGDEAARALTVSLAAAQPGWRYRPDAMAQLVNLRVAQYEQQPGDEQADLLVDAMARTLQDLDPDDDVRVRTARLAADLLYDLGQHVGLEEPDRMIALFRLGVEATEPDAPAHVYALLELASALSFRGVNGTATTDFDEAIEVLRRAVALAEGPLLALGHTRLCLAHLGRHERLEDRRDLEDGVAAGRAALAPARGEPWLADYCVTNLASILVTAHDHGVPGALDESVELLLTTVDTADDREKGRARTMLGAAYRKRYAATGDTASLDEAVRRHRSAGEVTPPTDYGYADHANDLAAALVERSRRFGSDADLDEAIELYAAAVAHRPEGHPDRLLNQANLVQALLDRYHRHGDPDSASQASALAREIAAAELPAGMAPIQLAAVGNALITAYESFGSAADLDDAIAMVRRGLQANDRPTPSALNQLGSTLIRRYERTRATADLVEAVHSYHAALSAAGPTDTLRPEYLSNLCNGLEELYLVTGDLRHLDAAVRAGVGAVAGPVGADRRISSLTNLAKAYTTRYRARHDVADLDHAIAAGREALEAAGPTNAQRVRYLSNLGGMLGERFEVTGEARDLDEAVAALREAASRTAPGDTRYGNHLYNLGLVLVRRHQSERAATDHAADLDSADLVEAVEALSTAAASVVSPALRRIQAASLWADVVAEHDVTSSLAGYEQAVALLPVLAWHGLHRHDQERQLVDLVGVASHAAATALAAGRPERAVELLEQGRSVLWSQLLDLRTDFVALRDARPDLARRLDELREGLERTSTDDAVDPTPAARDRRMTLARHWDETVAEVRRLPGLADFLRPRPCAELLGAAAGGPVVIVNVSRLRCDALIVTTDEVEVVPLPDLTSTAASEHADRLAAAGSSATDLAGVVEHNTVLNDVLTWLWRVVAQPVLDHLGPVPRLWWCPTGAMTRLPLHAAGLPGTTESVPDRTVSSYTPTLRALSLARDEKPADRDRVLVVAVAGAPNAAPLEVDPEVAVLTDLAPGRSTVHRSTDATRGRVLADLPGHSHVHFACHGAADTRQPSASGLLLHDQRLTVTDVSRLRLRGELAYLSACDTATGGDLPDESLHLGAAFHLAGYRNVVATLWPIYDSTAALVARGFYQRLDTDGHTASALHEAVKDLRGRGWDAMPSVWVPYLHVGP